MGGAGAVWRHGSGWPRAIGVAVLAAALFAEGFVFGAPRLVHLDQLGTIRARSLFAARDARRLVLPWFLLRRGERFRGYAATAGLGGRRRAGDRAGDAVLRSLADRF